MDRKMRVEEKLTIKIGDAKNLLGGGGNNGANGNSSAGKRDVYCTIALDQEEVYRTMQERTLSPFFDELFEFEVPRKFRYLSLYVWARDGHLKQQDKAVGKIAIRREELHLYNNKDHWFPLRPVDADSEVQGMANIRVTIDHGAGHLRPKYDGYSENELNDAEHRQQQYSNNIHHSQTLGRSESCRTSSMMMGGSIAATAVSSTLTKSRSLFGHGDLSLFHTTSRKSSQHSSNLLHLATKGRVSVSVAECVDLARKNGHCDPFVVCVATYSNGRVVKKRSKGRKKTTNPHFDEVLSFDLTANGDTRNDNNNAYTIAPVGGADLNEVCVTVWHSGGMTEDVFLGEVRIPLRGKQQQNAVQANAWYYLQARSSQLRPAAQSCATPPGTRLSVDNSLGSLRLKINYVMDQVFPLATYDALLNVLVESVAQRPVTTTMVYNLGEVASKLEVAQPLVRLFTHQKLIAPMIRALADHEISTLTDPTTIFRGNTLVSKMMDEAMKLSGSQYLHATLRPIVDEIVAEKRPCEIDPGRVKDRGQIEANLKNLSVYVAKVFEAITSSAVRCPAVLCQIFHDLKECAATYFPDNREIRYSVVSGFIFLRFFAPAILGPKLFDLTTRCAILDNQTNRTLTLISKTIQYLGNLVSSRSAQPCKEEYTGQLYRIFSTEEHIEAVKKFLEVISSMPENQIDVADREPILLKEGLMAKRAQGRNRFFRHNSFKPRYFRLTTQSLSYAKSKGQKATCDIPLRDICAVEQLHEQNFKLQNIFQIVKKDRPLFVQTSNCVEEKEWVDILRKICQTNEDSRNVFHPCAYTNNIWSCCNEPDQDAEGCKTVSSKPFQLDLCTSFDPARDLQRIHSLITRHMKDIETLISTPIVKQLNSPYIAGVEHLSTAKTVKFDELRRTTLERVREIALNLDQVHMSHRSKLARETKLGSRQAPIGEDNYLHTTRSNLIIQNGGAVPYLTKKEMVSIVYPRSLTMYGNEYTTLGNGAKAVSPGGGGGGVGNVTITTTNSSPNSSMTGHNNSMVGDVGSITTVTLPRQSPIVFSP